MNQLDDNAIDEFMDNCSPEEFDEPEEPAIETIKSTSEPGTETKIHLIDNQSVNSELKKAPSKEVDLFQSPKSTPVRFQPTYKATPKKDKEKSPESELEEISGQDFKKKSPERKMDQSNDPRSIFFDSKGQAYTKDTLVAGSTEVSVNSMNSVTNNEQNRETSDDAGKKGKSYNGTQKIWWNEPDPEVPVNCVMVYNLDSRVDEEIIYELFCKVGKIKRMKLFRISKREIDTSNYLKGLSLGDNTNKPKPHKKKALVEYHAPNYVEMAIEVLDNLKLFGRKIFVRKYRDDYPKYNIIFIRPYDQSTWFDEFFCLDYFSKITNLVRVWAKRDIDYKMKIAVFFASQQDWEEGKDAINKELKKYLNNKIETMYNPMTNIPSRERKRDIKAGLQERLSALNYHSPTGKEEGQSSSEDRFWEEKGMEVE